MPLLCLSKPKEDDGMAVDQIIQVPTQRKLKVCNCFGCKWQSSRGWPLWGEARGCLMLHTARSSGLPPGLCWDSQPRWGCLWENVFKTGQKGLGGERRREQKREEQQREHQGERRGEDAPRHSSSPWRTRAGADGYSSGKCGPWRGPMLQQVKNVMSKVKGGEKEEGEKEQKKELLGTDCKPLHLILLQHSGQERGQEWCGTWKQVGEGVVLQCCFNVCLSVSYYLN